ncbi:MAG: hypothetical protein ACKV2V_06495 [Blastocatellia bacterium]
MLTEHRQRLLQFQTELNLAEYLYASGQPARQDVFSVWAEHSDLFTPARIAELKKLREETSESRETDRAALTRLIAMAIDSNVFLCMRELSREIRQREDQPGITHGTQTLTLSQARFALTREPNPQARQEIHARMRESLRRLHDLREEWIEKLSEAARAHDHPHYLSLCSLTHEQPYEALATQAASLLNATESVFVTTMSDAMPRELGQPLSLTSMADLPYLRRQAALDRYFPGWQFREIYEEIFRGLGLRVWQRTNVTLESCAQPRRAAAAFCAPVEIPTDIRVVRRPLDGVAAWRASLHATGQAQHLAWTSEHLAVEFRLGVDTSVNESWGMLFAGLLHEPRWLSGTMRFYESRAPRQTQGLLNLLAARTDAATHVYETELQGGKLSGAAPARYAELLSDAIRMTVDPAGYLYALRHPFAAAARLRARAFESQLREHMKTKYGHSWWLAPRAGDMLADLWNLGFRHSPEQLSRMIGLGELSFDYLATELLADCGSRVMD